VGVSFLKRICVSVSRARQGGSPSPVTINGRYDGVEVGEALRCVPVKPIY